MHDLTALGQALVEPTRVRLLAALRHGELCVCELVDALEISQSTLSGHLQVLRQTDLVATRKTLRGTHRGEIWDLPPTGNQVEWEFIDIFRVSDGKLREHWTHMDFEALRVQMRPKPGR